MAQNRRRSSGSGLTPKQKQAALVLGICALVLIITISVVAVIVSKAGKNPDSSSSGPASGSTSTPAVENNFNPGQYGDAVLGETDDAGKSYIEETIFVGDSNTSRYYQNGLLDLDHVVALDGLGIQQLTSQKDIYFKGDDTGYSIPEALAKMKPRRIIVMMGTTTPTAACLPATLRAITRARCRPFRALIRTAISLWRRCRPSRRRTRSIRM